MDDLLQRGIAAVKAGDRDKARELLAQVIRADPHTEDAWLWLARVVDEPDRKRACYQRVLAINPNSDAAQEELMLLNEQPSSPLSTLPSSDPGWIYVLMNPSMEGIVKIGKTQRDPEERAKELSSATGVPTPFHLAYRAYFRDCSQAEAYVHTLLEQRNCRVSDNREFFKAPLHVVVDAIVEAKNVLEQDIGPEPGVPALGDLGDVLLDTSTSSAPEPWRSAYEMAGDHYYGLGDTIQDYEEALELYKQAANLGCTFAYWNIGRMYRDGEGCNQDAKRAKKYYREGISQGDHRCWAEMAMLFGEEEHVENWNKCWRKYFESEHFKENTTYEDSVFSASHYAFRYLQGAMLQGYAILFKEYLLPIREQIIGECNHLIEVSTKTGHVRSAQLIEERRKEIEKILQPPRKRQGLLKQILKF